MTRPTSKLSAFEVTALLAAALSLFGALGGSLWDPPEVETAELARRVAEGLFGAARLGSGESVPTRGELGKGELPFLAMALGFRVFGLLPWAARLPLALCAAAGVFALFVAVRRLASRRAAGVAALVLSTTPLYYLQARTLLGDIATLSAMVLGFSGHALFAFDEQRRARWLGLGLASLGAVVGFFTRGPLLGVAPAALGVGVTWLALVLAGQVPPAASRRAGALSLAVGVVAVVSGALAWYATPFDRYSFWIGTTRSAYPHPTFEAGLRQFLHAGFPWSALALPALGQVLYEAAREPDATPRARLCFAAVMSAVSAFALETALTPSLGPLPGSGLPMLAVVVGLALDATPPNRSRALLGLGGAVLAALLVWDFFHFPDKLLVSLGAPLGTLPETWDRYWFGLGAGATFAAFAVAAWCLVEPGNELSALRLERGAAAAWALAGLGLAGSLVLAPALWFELPENPALAAYQKRAKSDDALGLLHGALPAARYRPGARVTALYSVDQALNFLGSRDGARHFVALAPSELGPLNAAYRARATPRRNLPVVDTTTRTWLVTGRLLAAELDLNPLRAAVFDARPTAPARVLDAELGHALALTGWELRDREGVVRSEVIAGEWYDLYLYFEVRSRLDRAWRIFVHGDGFQQRFNADHEPLDASYSTDLWMPGDWIVDRHRFRVDTELAPGSYSVYAGMHMGEERLPVTRGSAGADRIFLGAVRVD